MSSFNGPGRLLKEVCTIIVETVRIQNQFRNQELIKNPKQRITKFKWMFFHPELLCEFLDADFQFVNYND